ncbi:MAG: PAS domain S-box protein [Candidatus Eremiobacteraeota bacterium]|nr:PAS domain S-box protein [Candidatus Eremiobacteraeota bacterium]
MKSKDLEPQAGEALRESEDRYRSLFENATIAIFLARIDGTILDINAEFARMFGYESPAHAMEAAGKGCQFFADPARREELVKELRGGREPLHAEVLYRRKDGSTFNGALKVRLARDERGAPEYLEGFIGDITEQKHYEEALSKSEQSFRTLTHNVPAAVYRVHLNEQGRMEFFNEEIMRITGYALEELTHGEVCSIDPLILDDREYIIGTVKKALRNREPFEVEYRLKARDGSVHCCLERGQPLYDDEGKPRYIDGIILDITGRRQAEEEALMLLSTVKGEKEKLSSLLNSINDEVWFNDTRQKFTLANPSALEEFKLSPGKEIDVRELAGSLEVFRPDGSPRPVEEAPPLLALAGESIRNLEEIIRSPASGELRHRQVSSSPVRDDAGKIIGAVSVVRDITDKKRAEKELRRALEEKSVLLRELQHRAKNTLIMLTSLVNLEMNQEKDPAARSALKSILNRMSTFSDLYCMLYADGYSAEIRLDCYLEQIARSLVKSGSGGKGSVKLALSLEEMKFDGKDASCLGLIVNELVTNALRHGIAGERGGTVSVSLKENDGFILLEVADDGGGLPGAFDLSHAPGLGLDLVSTLAMQLGGEATCEGGERTRFTVKFRKA